MEVLMHTPAHVLKVVVAVLKGAGLHDWKAQGGFLMQGIKVVCMGRVLNVDAPCGMRVDVVDDLGHVGELVGHSCLQRESQPAVCAQAIRVITLAVR